MGAARARLVIAGGGVAGLEAMLALSDLCGDRAELTLLSPEPDFVYKPLLVEEPFGLDPAERHELAPLAAEKGARFLRGALRAVWVAEPEPPPRGLDVEVAVPREWHGEPMALDPSSGRASAERR